MSRATRRATRPDAASCLRAADVADGQAVRFRGEVWRVWSKRGPRAGTCWLVRTVQVRTVDEWSVPQLVARQETTEAPYAELARVNSREVGVG